MRVCVGDKLPRRWRAAILIRRLGEDGEEGKDYRRRGKERRKGKGRRGGVEGGRCGKEGEK